MHTMGCTHSAHDTLLEIPCMMIDDPTMCRITTIALPPHKIKLVIFISIFDVDVFCLVGKRSGYQSLNS